MTPAHEILPESGTARRVRDGQPAQIINPAHYPVTATCLACGLPIRCDGWLLGDWYHTETE
jgi:hypothetical protein